MTIPKNTKRAKEVLASATEARVYTLANYFIGESVDPKYAAEALYASRSAKLSERNGRYVVHVHGNLWYEFS